MPYWLFNGKLTRLKVDFLNDENQYCLICLSSLVVIHGVEKIADVMV
jgi:hypothetical protein